ncbi:CBO0543 family protein [Bacillus sp. FJAT-45066]|uniref:CBO0543 family protein n=1 Tax=Bacillus sp. FJAT-45066 TaxID=2011010 RepID=UPI0034E95777
MREVVATFLFFQMLTWLFSIGLTNAGLLEAPVRFFKDATTINFTMEYLAFPTAAVLFQLYFPINAKFLRRLVHYLLWVGVILSFMILIGTFTNIMNIKIDNLIRSFFNFTIELWLCRRYVVWLFKQPPKGSDTYEY